VALVAGAGVESASATVASLVQRRVATRVVLSNGLAVADAAQSMFRAHLRTQTAAAQATGEAMHAVNRIRAVGGLGEAVKKGLIKTGLMCEIIRSKADCCIAASLTDEATLPGAVTCIDKAQEEIERLLRDAAVVIVLGDSPESCAAAGLLPPGARSICVAPEAARATALAARNPSASIAVAADPMTFLRALSNKLQDLG
jgi:hypothetical protein